MDKIVSSRSNDETVNQSRRAFFTGTRLKEELTESDFPQIAEINNRCFAIDGVACQICGDICEPRAIKFFWTSKKVPMPQINAESCTGCGDCLSICPPNAISLLEKPEVKMGVKTDVE
ncbi:MAG: 4Fe-4S dicluster domain-containing protein [Rhodospirillaceae bacterium]|jgi:formate hydrogenlyase subunit 6/NADH:ubiquinone oxidoreductase subunit I|nr:4Fe-4S dicluster domain-containing protein [Rhodospirillaceae bacterium]